MHLHMDSSCDTCPDTNGTARIYTVREQLPLTGVHRKLIMRYWKWKTE